MNLTPRAAEFLHQQERRTDLCYSPDALAEAFAKSGLVPSATLQSFQRDYAGLVIYAGLTPICFGLVHAKMRQRWFRSAVTSYELDFYKPDRDFLTHHFMCAATDYQENFTLDENGSYYEGFQRQASNFDGLIESWAVYAESWAAGYRQQWEGLLEEEDQMIAPAVLRTELQLDPYPAFPEDIIFWGINDTLLVRQSPDKLTLFARQTLEPSVVSKYKKLLGLDPN